MKHKLCYWGVLLTLVLLWSPATAWAVDSPVGVAYRGHIQDLGDYPLDGSWIDSPEIIGTVGQSKRIEGFEIKLTGDVPEAMELRYNVHVQNQGWLYDEDDCTDWPRDGAYAGTRGESLRIEAVKIVLTNGDGQPLSGYSVQYRGHVQNVGDLPADDKQWQADGEQLGTVGSSQRLEALLVQVVKTGTDPAETVVYDAAGNYGPEQGSVTLAGDVIVAADGVTLNNLVIQGNLTISEAVGDGTVTLNNVTVVGDTLVRGGGVNSIHINGGEYSRIVMEKTASGAVRIVATGVDGLAVVIAEDAAGETIILEGAFASVVVNAPNMTVVTQGPGTTITSLTVGAEAGGTTLNLATGTTVADLELNAKTAVKGQGTVAKATVKTDGVVFDKKPGTYVVAPGVVIPPVFPSDSGSGPTTIAVTAVSLNKAAVSLALNASESLTATVVPATATNKTVSWSSSDDTIATVDASGKVTAMSAGEATITVTSQDGNKKATCVVTAVFLPTEQYDITASGVITAYSGAGGILAVPATVNNIVVTGIGANAFYNQTAITAITLPATVASIGDSAFAGCSGLTAITFRGPTPTLGSDAIAAATTIKYYANYSGYTAATWAGYADKQVILAPPEMGDPVGTNNGSPAIKLTWSAVPGASAYDIYMREIRGTFTDVLLTVTTGTTADITTGLVAGKLYEFAVKARDADGESLLSSHRQAYSPYPIPVTALAIAANPTIIPMGTTGQLTATITPANATHQKVWWVTHDTDIATVNEDTGVITPVKPGTAKMIGIADDSRESQECLVTVVPVLVDSVSLDKENLAVGVSQTAQLNATVLPDQATYKTLTWISSDPAIATVDTTGKVTGVTEGGPVTITAKSADGLKLDSCTVLVRNLEPVISGIGLPSWGGTPTATLADTNQYSGTIAWQTQGGGSPGATFAADTIYVATLNLTLRDAYITADIPATYFTVPGATTTTTTSSGINTVVVTAEFPSTPPLAIDGSGVITAYGGSGGAVVIPEQIGGVTVTAIGANAFNGNTNVTAVSLPQTVTSIGEGAFHNCRNLATVNFAADCQLTSIAKDAFSECPLTSLTLPSQLGTIGDYSFYHNRLSGSLTIPATVEEIGTNAFEGKMDGTTHLSSLATLTFESSGYVTLKTGAFKYQPLTTITFPTAITIYGTSVEAQTLGTNMAGLIDLIKSLTTVHYDSGTWTRIP